MSETRIPVVRHPGRRAIWSWCLYDWANSAQPTVVNTFIIAAYVTNAVAATPEEGTHVWGMATGIAGLVVAVLGPIIGAIADKGGPRKPLILGLSLATVLATACLWFVAPEERFLILALTLVGIGTICFELLTVLYNAMLPDLVPEERIGRTGGRAWGLGYAGGLVCLAVCLFGFVQADPPPFGLDPESQEPVRATAIVVALWFAVFAIPFFLFTPDRTRTGLPATAAIKAGLTEISGAIGRLRGYPHIVRFLIARMLYADGLTTLFTFGGIYAAGTFGMSFSEIILFGIALNVTAGAGAFAFAWVDDKLGSKLTIQLSLAGLIVFGAAVLLVQSVTWFWITALAVGIFIGPVQSGSRSLMARLAPAQLRGEMFGLYALSGKATAFIGPMAVGWVTLLADSQRVGMGVILVLLVAGFLLLRGVRDP